MHPNPEHLISKIGILTPPIGFYDAPDAAPFAPLVEPGTGKHMCIFCFYDRWRDGVTLHITEENYGCGGAGNWLCGVSTRSRPDYLKFLVDGEGLKSSHELMNRWLDHQKPYRREHAGLLIGPLTPDQYRYLKSVTFFVNPDQLGALILGANYDSAPGDPPPVIAPFGAGCMAIAPLFDDFTVPQAIIGATDIAMRQYLPADILAFTVTVPMFERLCRLDEKSFLYKPFWKRLREARGKK